MEAGVPGVLIAIAGIVYAEQHAEAIDRIHLKREGRNQGDSHHRGQAGQGSHYQPHQYAHCDTEQAAGRKCSLYC